jgi:hypothetical protein
VNTHSRAAIVVVALLMAASLVFAQSGRPHRIEITRKPERGRIVRSGVEPRVRTTSAGVVDWMGQVKATTLSGGRMAMTVYGHDLTFHGGSYDLRGTPSLAIVAQTIRISGRVTFDLSAKDSGDSGGNVMILAESLQCASGAQLTVTSNGGNSSSPGVQGSDGGTVTIAADVVPKSEAKPAVPRPSRPPSPPVWSAQQRGEPKATRQSFECIAFSSTGGRGTGKRVTFTDRGGTRRQRYDPPEPGQPGNMRRLPSRAAAAAGADDLKLALSRWSLARLQRLRSDILDADAKDDNATLVHLFLRYAALTPPVDLHPKVRSEYDGLRAELNRYRGEALLPLDERKIQVTPTGGLARTLSVFTEGASLRQTLGPTHMLASPIDVDGRSVLGILAYDPARPDEIVVEVALELTVDPWLEALAAAKLRADDGDVSGMFSGWTLKARAVDDIGLKDSRITVVSGGRMRVRLVLDARTAAPLFWNLFSGVGIPLVYDWEYRGNSQTLTTGYLEGPTLSFARRATHTLRVEQGKVRNVGQVAAVVEYVGLNKSEFVALPRAVRIEPGQSVELKDVGVATPGPAAWIPPHAVVTASDPRDVERAFHVVNAQPFVEHVTVTNLLAAHDAGSGGALQYVEVFVALGGRKSAGSAGSQAGPFRLSAAHTTGSEIQLPFLRRGNQAESIIVWGAARYENGGCQTIAETTFDSSTVKITASMLVKNRPPQPGTSTPSPCGN